ncbi:MAG: DNA polymerase III subunit gamma/tau C-terminal domain-containing protein, partial [Gammaproteobacteria bacterium]
DLHLAPAMRAGFEMVLLRMLTFRPAGIVPPGSAAAPRSAEAASDRAAPREAEITSNASKSKARTESAIHGGPQGGQQAPPVARKIGNWNDLIDTMQISGAARQLASHCDLDRQNESSVVLTLDEKQTHMNTGTVQEKLRAALSQHFGHDVALKIEVGQPKSETPARIVDRKQAERQSQAVRSIETDANVLAMQEAFDAQVESESIKPLDS